MLSLSRSRPEGLGDGGHRSVYASWMDLSMSRGTADSAGFRFGKCEVVRVGALELWDVLDFWRRF